MTASDDEQPTAYASDSDETAAESDSPPTVAAEPHSDAPTTIVADARPTHDAELAWSSEAETEELADRSRVWRRRLLWLPLVALLCGSVAVVVWFSVTLYRQGRPPAAPPSSSAPGTAQPAHTAPPAVADDKDAQFLALIRRQGVQPPDVATAINSAHTICRRIAAGESEPDIASGVLAGSTTGINQMQADYIVDTAINIYCPQAQSARPPASMRPSAALPNITPQQANTICGWLRDPSWTMPQIESSTGDMLANDNPSFTGTPDVFKAIAEAMSGACPDIANQRPF